MQQLGNSTTEGWTADDADDADDDDGYDDDHDDDYDDDGTWIWNRIWIWICTIMILYQ